MPDPSERGVIPLWRLFATDFVSPDNLRVVETRLVSANRTSWGLCAQWGSRPKRIENVDYWFGIEHDGDWSFNPLGPQWTITCVAVGTQRSPLTDLSHLVTSFQTLRLPEPLALALHHRTILQQDPICAPRGTKRLGSHHRQAHRILLRLESAASKGLDRDAADGLAVRLRVDGRHRERERANATGCQGAGKTVP